jgi:tripartite-type tricarboxylate transporter receptor subunit TctC
MFHVVSRRAALVGGTALIVQGIALAQNAWPERPVRIVSVTSAGTGVDELGRLLAVHLGQKLGQSFFVEPKPGGNTMIACDTVAKAAPNGHTLLLAAASSISANPALFKNAPYDVNRDFVPVARMSVLPATLMVPANSPYKTVAELMAAGLAKPGKLNYGTSSAGYRTVLRAINGIGKVDAVDVSYKAMSNLLPDLMVGTLDYTLLEASAALPHIQAGKLRALAVSSPSRLAAMPDVPTFSEAGIGEAALLSWTGIFAPAATPKPIVDKLATAILEFVATPEASAFFARRGTVAFPSSGNEFSSFIRADQENWRKYIAAAGIQPE